MPCYGNMRTSFDFMSKKEKIDALLAVGGGSTIDATKFIVAGAYYDGDVWDILTGKAPVTNCLSIVTVLTLSATGLEMDAGGVISNLDTKVKIGYMHPMLLPKVSFLDTTNLQLHQVLLKITFCKSIKIT